jgi:hypothetical protein
MRSHYLSLLIAFGLMVFSNIAYCGVLPGLPAIYGPGTPQGSPTGETVNVNNDNVGIV